MSQLHCSPLLLRRMANSPLEVTEKELELFDAHLPTCEFCSTQFRILQRLKQRNVQRECERTAVADLAGSADFRLSESAVILPERLVGLVHKALETYGETDRQRFLEEVVSSQRVNDQASPDSVPEEWSHYFKYAVAACLLVCIGITGYGGGFQVARAATSQTIAGLQQEVTGLLARLKTLPKQPVMDAMEHAEKGREFSVDQGNTPTQAIIRLSPFLGMPYYAGLDVDWGDYSAVDKLYFAGKELDNKSQMKHTYAIAEGAQELFDVVLTYYRSGEVMESRRRDGREDSSQMVKERLTLRVCEAGVRVVSGTAANIVSASISNPSDDHAVVSQAEPSIRMVLKAPRQQGVELPSGQRDRVIQLVVRALDGPDEARRFSLIEPFTVSVEGLVQADGETEHVFDTWLSLPGTDGPTTYEILVIELPVALVQQKIDRRIMDFDDPAVREEVVRASRVILYQPEPDDE